MIIMRILQIVGALGMFLYGMKIMSDGIQKAAGERLQSILNYMTINRFAAVFTGFAVTAIVQSSSATTVMVVSFVNAGLLNLTQSIGVIMGANIGTTVTGWIVALFGFKFSLAKIALPIIGIGFPLYFARRETTRDWGEFLIGFGLLFEGLSFLKKAVPTVNAESIDFLQHFAGSGMLSVFVFIIAGTLLTILVHSSSASTAITLTLAFNNIINYDMAIGMILGSNIGTTIDAYLASIGTNVNARRAARVHLMFNVFGAFVAFLLFVPFKMIVALFVSPTDVTTSLATYHTVFNVINTALFLPFVNQMAGLVSRVVRAKEGERETNYKLQYLTATVQDTPEIYLMNAKKEINDMSEIVKEMYTMFTGSFKNTKQSMVSLTEESASLEELTDQMQEELTRYLFQCSKDSVSEKTNDRIQSMIRVVDELESIGDSCHNLMILRKKQTKKDMTMHESAMKELEKYASNAADFIDYIITILSDHTGELARAENLEEQINGYRNRLSKKVRKYMQSGEADVRAELLFLDYVKHIEHIGDYCMNIAQTLPLI